MNAAEKSQQATAYDAHPSTGTVTVIEETPDAFTVTYDSWCFRLARDRLSIVPVIGDEVTTYSYQGSIVRGVAINGVMQWWDSDEEIDANRRRMLSDYEARQHADFERDREKLDAQYEALPPAFKRRLDRFREGDPAFRWRSEGYESFTLTEAAAIAEHFGNDHVRIEEWWDGLEESAGTRMFSASRYFDEHPGVISDQHSGNTFGGAIHMARVLLSGKPC